MLTSFQLCLDITSEKKGIFLKRNRLSKDLMVISHI